MIPVKVYNILIDLVPMIILFSVVMILTRLISLLYAHEKIVIYKELKTLVYVIYCFALFQLVTTSDFESYSNNFTLFKEIMRYEVTSPLFYRNVLGNIAIFIPFGYLITDMIKEKTNKANIFITLTITFVTSVTIEVIQMFIGRSFDVDDILLNFIGGLIGFLIFIIFHFISKLIPDKFKTNIIKLLFFITVVVLLMLIIFMYI